MVRKKLAAAAAGLLALGSVQVAQAQSRADVERASAALEESSDQYGGINGGWIIAGIIAVAVGVGIYFLTEEGDDTVSP